MTAPRVLLHIGLPKTATSSLQHNVFQKLYEENKINFLGKCLDYNYKTGKITIYNYSGKFIRDGAEGALSVQAARERLSKAIRQDCLNVFSDEGLMVAYPGKENRLLARKFASLAQILEGYDVQVVVTLRDPIDYLYSLYVQLYPEFFSRTKDLDSLQKYTRELLANPNGVEFESFFVRRWLPLLKKKFDVKVFRYEELAKEDPSAYESWAALLGLSADEFRRHLHSKRRNVKEKSGNEVRKIRDFKSVETKMRILLSANKRIFLAAKWIYNVSHLKRIVRYRFSSRLTHQYPAGEEYKRLRSLLY